MRRTLAILTLLAATPAAFADAGPLFPQGSAAVDLMARYGLGLDGRTEHAPQLAVGADYFVLDNLSLGAEVAGYYVVQAGR